MRWRYLSKKLWHVATEIRKLPPRVPRKGERTIEQWAAGVAREADACARFGRTEHE